MLRAADSSPRRRHPRHHHHAAGPAPGGRIDFGALRQWAGTGEIQQAHSSGRRRRYRLGRWQSRSASSWNPPNSAPSASVAQMASQSRRSLVSIDISHKPSESRRSSVGSMQPEAAAHSIESFDDGGLGGAAGPLAEVLLRENDEIWNNGRLAALFARPAAKRDDAPDTALGDAPLEEPVADETLDEPVAFFMIVLATGVVTLHHSNVPHVRNTVARLKLDEDAVRLTPDYVAYLLLDDITDTLVPTTRLLELEVDAIDELVLILTRAEHDDVLKRIGIERRHALWLVRLLHGKAEVLRAVERRVQAKAAAGAAGAPRSSGALRRRQKPADVPADVPAIVRSDSGSDSGAGDSSDSGSDSASDDALASQWLTSDEEEGDLYALSRRPAGRASERPDVAKYLADVHDHLISLTASVHHCERILARAHGNYLARINLELTHASNTTNQLATQMTVLAGIFLPLNLVAGIFGMNVKVPGRDRDDLRDFGLIVGAMALFVVLTLGFCRWRRII
ncbi:CorA metal ion transporter [Coemansia sp. Cherry 401B]|nr:CorA metal ion transporter [Coemansia sp. Cherry 401B]